MKINQVKQFLSSNIKRFEKCKENYYSNRFFDLYDKNNAYRGQYHFLTIHSNGHQGIKTSMSTTRIMNDIHTQKMQEIVYMDKDFVNIYSPDSKDLTKIKPLPKQITTITTVLDFVSNKFKTVKFVSKLKNNLQRIGKDNPDFVASDKFVVYEPLKERPIYEKGIEYVREGSISETYKHPMFYKNDYSSKNSINQIPYVFW